MLSEPNLFCYMPDSTVWKYNISDPLEYPPPHPTYPIYPVWTGLSRKIESMFISLSFAYIATNNITYAEKI